MGDPGNFKKSVGVIIYTLNIARQCAGGLTITRIQIDLPDATAQAARDAGLLTPEALTQLLKDAMRRQAAQALLAGAARASKAGSRCRWRRFRQRSTRCARSGAPRPALLHEGSPAAGGRYQCAGVGFPVGGCSGTLDRVGGREGIAALYLPRASRCWPRCCTGRNWPSRSRQRGLPPPGWWPITGASPPW